MNFKNSKFTHILLASTCKSAPAQYKCPLLIGACTKTFKNKLTVQYLKSQMCISQTTVNMLPLTVVESCFKQNYYCEAEAYPF